MGGYDVLTSEHEHNNRELPRAGRGERAVLLGSSIVAWTALPVAVALYLINLLDQMHLGFRGFDEVEVWLLALACVGYEVASLRADDAMIEHAWHEGLRLAIAPEARRRPRVRFFARPRVWAAMGYVACGAWTAAAIVTYLVVHGTLHPRGSDLLLGMLMLLVPAIQGTVVRLIGPGLFRIRAAYEAACDIQRALQEHAELYEYLREVDCLEVFELLRSRRVLEVIQVVNAMIDNRTPVGERTRWLHPVEDNATSA